MNVLLVDDDKVIRDALCYSLETEGYSVYTAEDGIQALSLINTTSFGIVVTDVIMPNLSGLGLLSILKRFYFEKIPVILISAAGRKDLLLSAHGLGAADFIVKPFTVEEIKAKIRKIAPPN